MEKKLINEKAKAIYRSLIEVADILPSPETFERIALQMFTEGYKVAYEDAYADAQRELQASDDTPVITDDLFEQFWQTYDKKVGRQASARLWKRLTLRDRELVLKYIPLYVKAQPDKRYRKNPATFLRQKGWLDELIPTEYAQREYRKQHREEEARQLADALLNIQLEE